MCQKQCRDENGFKCHTMSESHLRQMRVYSEDPTRIMEDFSNEVRPSLSPLESGKVIIQGHVTDSYQS